MSLRPNTCAEVPPSTAAVARLAFPRGNPYLRLRDALGTVFSDAQFAPLFPSRGQPAETPWRLALVTVLQFAENLSDRRGAGGRLSCAIETLRAALSALATAAPEWLRAHADPAWPERYAKSADEVHIPQGEAARRAYAEQVGHDGHVLLATIMAPDAPAWLREVPAVELLRRVWVQTFCLVPAEAGAGGGASAPGLDNLRVRWRTSAEGFPPALLRIASPYDPDMHFAQKRSTTWIGYKVHVTETCDEGRPHLITHVETTPAPVVDRDTLQQVHGVLAAKDLLPTSHLVHAGYVDAEHLLASRRDHGVRLIGPTPKDQQWQARTPGAFTLQDFRLDWDRQVATCPAGHPSQSWTADQAHETQEVFAAEYRQRAGIEGTLSQGVRVMALRRARYIGLAKVHLQHVLTAAALNLVRLAAWLTGSPLARTRQSTFIRLMAHPA